MRTERLRADREAADPIGVAPSITAGERSHPRTGTPPLIRPHGGRTSCRRRANGGMPVGGRRLVRDDHWTYGSLAAPRVCLRPTRGNGKLDPHGSAYLYASFPQVRLWLTRGYRKFAPYGGACLAVCLTSRRTFCRMGICLRRDAIHRVSHVPDGPAAGKNVVAGLRPERVDARMASLLWRMARAAGDVMPRGRRPRRGRAMRNLGWSAAEPEVGWRVEISASKRSLCPVSAGGIDASSWLSSFCGPVPRVPLRSTRGYL